MAYLIGSGLAAVGAPGEVHTTQKNALGSRMRDNAGNEYIYLAGVASTNQYDWVTYNVAFATARLIPDAVGPVAIASAAIVANNWGWYLIKGSGLGASDAMAGATTVRVFIDTVTGVVDDAIVTGDQVYGAFATTTGGAASGTGASGVNVTFLLNYPYCSNDVAL